ncbi:MAG: hypothetical protein J0I87_13860 [Cellulomonas sp.]|nr:hypothetical protein [Cellulomonas sp.]
MSLQEQLAQHLAHVIELVETDHEKIAAALVQTNNGNRLRAARPLPAGIGGRPLLWAGAGWLVGWALTATATTTITLRDSRDTTGDAIASIAIAAGGSAQLWMGPGGVSFGEGLFVDAAIGSVFTGSIWLGAVD